MKSNFTLLLLLISLTGVAQISSSFEALLIEQDTFLNGRDAIFYEDGDAIFPSHYNFEWNYWESGWAISSMRDSMTSGPENLYSAKSGQGMEGSQNYAVGQQNAVIALKGEAVGQPLKGVYITNTTYAHNSMRDGDDFAKKFGGPSGDDPDYFKLTIRAYAQGTLFSDSVEFYLADYRFEDNAMDYIVNDWTWVDLSSLNVNVPLGAVDSLLFKLTSTDVSPWGPNTPSFFCIDNFNSDELTALNTLGFPVQQLVIFPNPAENVVTLELANGFPVSGIITVFDAAGKVVIEQKNSSAKTSLDISHLSTGLYTVRQTDGQYVWVGRMLKR
jgi:hypothetical protein